MPAIHVVSGLINNTSITFQLDPTLSLDAVIQQVCSQLGLKDHHSHFCLHQGDTPTYLTDLQNIQADATLYVRVLPVQVFITRAEVSTKSPISASQAFKHLNDHLMLLVQQDPRGNSPIVVSPGLIEKIVQLVQSKPYFIDLLVRILNWGNITVEDPEHAGVKGDLFSAIDTALGAFEKRTKTNFYLSLLDSTKNEGMIMRCVSVANRLLTLAPDSKYTEHILETGVVDKLMPYITSTSPSLQTAFATLQSHLLSVLDKRSTLPLDFREDPQQSEQLGRIWYVACPRTKYPGPESGEWRWLGFKGFPEDNFGNALSLDNMAYFAMTKSLTFRSMLLEQSESSFQCAGYPMGSTGASVTAILIKVYNIGTPRYVNQPIKLLFGTDLRTLFNDLYCTTFEIWDWLWFKAGFAFPQYQQSLGLLSMAIEKVYSKNLPTLKDYETAAKEILLAEINSHSFTKSSGDIPESTESQESAPQPSNVKSYKLKKRLGVSTAITWQSSSDQHEEDEEEEFEQDEETKAKRQELERARRLRGFFGEWFDIKEVEFSEKLKPSYAETQTVSVSSQPENAGVKLQKFFGERVRAPPHPMSENDEEGATIRRSRWKLQQMLGEAVDAETSAPTFAAQPAHVKVYKLDRKFGEKTPYSSENAAGANDGGDESTEGDFDESGHHKQLQKYFGERFDIEQVRHEEKLKPRLDAPAKAVQPENTRVDKIHKFFGERMSIRVKDDGEEVSEPEEDDDEEEAPRRKTTMQLKARRQLGEGIDIEKEATAVNFAPQPGHVKAFKLDKMFGQRVPHSPITSGEFPPVGAEDDEDDEQSKERERRRRLQTFFGERFDDLDKVVQEEKLKAALAEEQRLQQGTTDINNNDTPTEDNEPKKERKLRDGVEKRPKKEGREGIFTLRTLRKKEKEKEQEKEEIV